MIWWAAGFIGLGLVTGYPMMWLLGIIFAIAAATTQEGE